MKKRIFAIASGIIMLMLFRQSYAQEKLLPLRYNAALMNQPQQAKASPRATITLPFFDDFSYAGPYPNPNLWEDRQAFVNTTFPIAPPSIGVATLDGLNERGVPYDTVSFNINSVDSADHLTSVPILMGSYSPADSVYFSFLFEPGGYGDPPNSKDYNTANGYADFGDSLVLEFKDNTGHWRHIRGYDGKPLQGSFRVDSFRQVMIPVTDTAFFHDDFQFRFRNYATLIGNFDQWHIDYVKMNSHRSFSDTILADVAIQYLPTSILANYQAIPWNQFQNYQNSEKANAEFLTVQNNNASVENTSAQFVAYEKITNTPIYTSSKPTQNLEPQLADIFSLESFSIPDFTGDSVVITSKYIISPNPSGNSWIHNDTVSRDQVFSNYFAYDDSSAELRYELLGSPAFIAQQYHVNQPDSIRAIAINFQYSTVNIQQTLISLIVWKSLTPQDTLFREDLLKPAYSTKPNGFILYRLSRPVAVSDTFYIGWEQTGFTNEVAIDVGFDKNDISSSHLFLNTDGVWRNSLFEGTVMMRPYMNAKIPFGVGIGEVGKNDFEVQLFPNPASEELQVIASNGDPLQIEVMDYTGRILMQQKENELSVDVRELASGFYLLKATDVRTGKSSIQKFIKSK